MTLEKLTVQTKKHGKTRFLSQHFPIFSICSNQNTIRRRISESEWSALRFRFLTPGPISSTDATNVSERRLFVHWDSLDEDLQRFLLDPEPFKEPKIKLGIEAIKDYASNEEKPAIDLGFGIDLRVLEAITGYFAQRNVNLHKYEKAKPLTADDWYAIGARISEVRSNYRIWWPRPEDYPPGPTRDPGISDFIEAGFGGNPASETYWNALTLSLDGARQADALLTVEIALSRLWEEAKGALRSFVDQKAVDPNAVDTRVATFVVIDEAHNFAPENSNDPLRNRVTSRLMQIASEGRKFGLYLILATQRPTKLHKELVPECENSCVLRIQSDLELKSLCDNLGYADHEIQPIKLFDTGRGLFNGRWLPPHQNAIHAIFAPARTVVGGTGLGPGWKQVPKQTAGPDPMIGIGKFVEDTLRSSETALPLARLAKKLRDEFGLDDWLGHASLQELLLSSKIQDKIQGLKLATTPPGYAYLEDIHLQPAPTLSPEPPLSDDGEDKLQNMSEEAQAIIHRFLPPLRVPLLSAAEFEFVLKAISNEVQQTKFNCLWSPRQCVTNAGARR